MLDWKKKTKNSLTLVKIKEYRKSARMQKRLEGEEGKKSTFRAFALQGNKPFERFWKAGKFAKDWILEADCFS